MKKRSSLFGPEAERPLRPALTPEVEFDMELAGSIKIPYSQLDHVLTSREYVLYAEFYKKHGRFPGQAPGIF